MSKIKKIILLVLSIIILVIPCLSLNTFALQEVWFSCDKPIVTENSGYVEVVSSAGVFVFVVFTDETDDPAFYTTYDNDGYLYFHCDIDNQLNKPNCYSYYLTQDGKAKTTPFYTSGNYSYFRVYDIYKINGYNVEVSRVPASVPTDPYSFFYASDVIINDTLNKILGVLSANSGNSQQIIDAVTNNNNENTQDIIDNQNQLQQNEKDEAQQSGESSVDDVSGAIEDKSSGFINSLGNLIQTMSYTGTECAWKFPSIKLPAIDGIMPEYKLTDEQPIDFKYWVEKIPSEMLLLIRSILTIALIVYCFKELYSTISYVLTLKGGGNSE